jgi:GT2 family glycosyltransferase/glycosyltransferase involved in cell wall biosynthesis
LTHPVKVLFASGSDAVIAQTLEQLRNIFPELPLVVVSEFPPPEGEWIPYHIRRRWRDNYALAKSRLRGRSIRIAAVILEPRTPHWRLRLLGLTLAPWRLLAFNETGRHFRVRPDNLPVMLRHLLWRGRNLLRSQSRKGGWLHDTMRLIADPRERRLLLPYLRARAKTRFPRVSPALPPWPPREQSIETAPGISVVIPSRNGRDLLAACLPRLDAAGEIIVIDNGSSDGTAEYLATHHAGVVVEHSPEPLAFAEAVNRGLRRARFSHVCLLNNDMMVEPGFLDALRCPFDHVPDLFAATAQIFLPPGQRREETGKTVWAAHLAATDFPVRCTEPLEGEDLSYVLYGSGGCTVYDAAKLAALGGFDRVYETAYVEDLDLGVRAWQHGWPSVYCAQARVLHQHRATTSRYFTPAQLDEILERNFIRFLARVLPQPELWRENLRRLRSAGKQSALETAARISLNRALSRAARPRGSTPDRFLDLVSGDVSVFPGKPRSDKPVIVIASPYLPYPLSHGAAVRMYNLMNRAASDFDQVLVSFVEQPVPVPPELASICTEIVTVRRTGSHALPSSERPDTVEEFDSPAFHAALRQTVAKWHPPIAQLEFTQMAQYVQDCLPARTILVEHDITYDLYAQMLAREEDWENRRQYGRWLRFETAAWRSVDRVVTMSEKDRRVVPGAVAIPNGVDLDRFHPSDHPPEPRRLLFIGSFAHHPNVLAVEFFVREVFPLLPRTTLHVIAGQRHERFWDLRHAGVEVEGFVADVRPAYQRATLVIAPLVASAGTNIKILEAMAMGKAIVSTEAGIHGLELERGSDVMVADTPADMARTIARLLDFPEDRAALESHARRTASDRYGWDEITLQQKRLYESLISQQPTRGRSRSIS